jgi:hypothetical protein
MQRWKQYFYETLNIKDDVAIREEAICQEPEEKIEPPSKEEVWGLKRMLKNTKSPGEENISVELIKYRNKKLWDEIHALMEYGHQKECQGTGKLQYAPYISKINDNAAIIDG